MTKFLNSPFALSESKGIVEITSCGDVGYWGYGSLMSGFIIWLLNIGKTVLFIIDDTIQAY